MLANAICVLRNGLWIMLYISVCQGKKKPEINCTMAEYVAEGHDLICDCLPSSASHNVSWSGHSNNSTLYVATVNRTMNGTQYTCQEKNVREVEVKSTIHTLRVAYGPDEGSLSITQSPPQVILDGVTKVTLTCNADTYPEAEYTWKYTKSKLVISCENKIAISNQCTYIPNVNNTDHKVTCTCINTMSHKFQTKEIEPKLQYPPPDPPVISLEGSKNNRLSLDFNNRLKCEVKGGKPQVDSIDFACASPRHDDTPDVSGTGVVTSYVTVTSLQDEDGNMTCTCSATWRLKPELYLHNSTAVFLINDGPNIINYTVNGSSEMLTSNESHTSVFLVCVVKGRPAPTVIIQDASQIRISNTTQSSPSQLETTAEATLAITDCNQTGVYTCTASNSLRTKTGTVLVNITCPPTLADTKSSNALPAVPTVTEDLPLTLTLKANPVPRKFDFFYLNANASDVNVTSGQFEASCRPDTDRPLYMAVCRVVVINAPSGLFNATVCNSEGSISFQFKVEKAADKAAGAFTNCIIVGVVTGVVIIIAGAVVAFVIVRRRRAPRQQVNGNSNASCGHRKNSVQGPRPVLENYEEAWDLKPSPLAAALAPAGEGTSEPQANIVDKESAQLTSGSANKAQDDNDYFLALTSSSTPSPGCGHRKNSVQGPRRVLENYEEAWDLKPSPLAAALAPAREGTSEPQANIVDKESAQLTSGSANKAQGDNDEYLALTSSSTPSPDYLHQDSTESTAFLIPSRNSAELIYKATASVTSSQHAVV